MLVTEYMYAVDGCSKYSKVDPAGSISFESL